MNQRTTLHGTRAFTTRQYMLAAGLVTIVTASALGGYLYYRSNSPSRLAAQAGIALERHDNTRALQYLKRALDKNPTGDLAVHVRYLTARALIDSGREVDARAHLQEALNLKGDDAGTLDLMAESYVHNAFRKMAQAPKPLAEVSVNDILTTVDTELAALEKLPQTPRYQVAQAQLHRLAYMILDDQLKQAKMRLATASAIGDAAAISKASGQIKAIEDPKGGRNPATRRDRAVALLEGALKQDPKNIKAAQFLVQYEYQDRHFARALEVYNKLKADNVVSADLAITGANVMIADAARQPVRKARFADAQKELEGYLAGHENEQGISRVLVAIGQTMLEQDKVDEAAAMAEKASAKSSRDLDAQILLINTKLRQKKTAEALALVMPLTTSHGNVPQVWYLLGLTNSENSDLRAAEDAFKKALALKSDFAPARRALLLNNIRSGQMDAAVMLATQVLQEDRYHIPAWEVTALDLQKHGQIERARNMLKGLAADPELPPEARPELVRLLIKYGASDIAGRLLESVPQAELRLRWEVLVAAGKFREARELAAKDIAANPNDVDARLRYAELLLKMRMPADARAQLDHVAGIGSKNPLSPNDWMRLARGYLFVRLPQQSIDASKQALALQPKSVEAQSLLKEGEAMLNGAPATQDSAIAVDPNQATIADNIRMANAALVRKDYGGTLSIARSGLSRDNGSVPLRHLAARALAGLKQYDQAVAEIIAAAQAQKESPASFAVFVELFPAGDALKGVGFGSALQAINPALGNWAMGRLMEMSGNSGAALTYYNDGIAASTKTNDPAAAKDVLFRSVMNLHAQNKDGAAIKTDAERFAKDRNFTVGIRLLAADSLRMIGDSKSAAEQLEKLTEVMIQNPAPNVILMVCQRWQALNRPERAQQILETYLAPGKTRDPQLLDAYASLLEARDPAAALKIRQEIAAGDPSNPQHKIALAQAQATAGEEAAAFRTLDEASTLGETGRTLATAARLRLLITMGLLQEAAGELSSSKSSNQDFGSMLAIGQAWTQLNKPEEARKILVAIPKYANEYPAAVATLATLDSSAGKFDAAIAALREHPVLSGELFQTHLRAGDPGTALELAKKEREQLTANTPQWRTWTIYAATAAREAKNYDEAVALLTSLDPDARRAAAFDIALLQLLLGKPQDAIATAAAVADEAPTFNRSTVLLLANSKNVLATKPATLITSGPASTVYAYLAANPPAGQKADLPGIEKNLRVLPGDIDSLLADAASNPATAVETLRQVALIQRLVEAGWSTAALAELEKLNSGGKPPVRLALVQAHRANKDLRRSAEAERIRAAVEQEVKSGKQPVLPSAQLLLAAAAAEKEDYPAAIAALESLTSLNRTDILTTLATFYERIGKLEQAIAMHRQVRKLDPNDILAANNLAYTLSAAKPNDKAALSEAKTAVQFAIERAPHVAVFQDTMAWIEILSGQPADGVKRLSRALPQLRLSPAVHYHLGIGYAKLGQTDLARLHLQNVQGLAQSKTPIPELPLATEALKTLAQK